jgi:hypothetical protein
LLIDELAIGDLGGSPIIIHTIVNSKLPIANRQSTNQQSPISNQPIRNPQSPIVTGERQ